MELVEACHPVGITAAGARPPLAGHRRLGSSHRSWLRLHVLQKFYSNSSLRWSTSNVVSYKGLPNALTVCTTCTTCMILTRILSLLDDPMSNYVCFKLFYCCELLLFQFDREKKTYMYNIHTHIKNVWICFTTGAVLKIA